MRIAALLFGALTACAAADEPPVPEAKLPADSACGAHALRYLEGEPKDTFDFSKLDNDVRILTPDGGATTDYVQTRLNVTVNKAGIITKLTCG